MHNNHTFSALAALFALCICACSPKQPYDDVWQEYDWVPSDAEFTNPYLIPPDTYYGSGQIYDNDSTYVPPHSFGMCNDTGNIFGCE